MTLVEALILKHTNVPCGIIVVHETGDVVLKCITPLSDTLYVNYTAGIRWFRYTHRRYEEVIPPKNLDKFKELAPLYYKQANLTLGIIPFLDNSTREVVVDGATYLLKEKNSEK